ncbi:hypothetical protein [Flagellimonas sp.]|uniref:hypothetical protein n=1 Tax=Flagellimonas sp. TaxID=2058762 RepID=UPI003AB14053
MQDLIDDDLWEGDLEAHPVTKELYSRTIDSNYSGIIDKVNYKEATISYGWPKCDCWIHLWSRRHYWNPTSHCMISTQKYI